ncbi:DmX-like protein 2 [Bienertia sinuspersici]
MNQSGGLFLACFATNLDVKIVDCTKNFIFCKIVDGRKELWETINKLLNNNPGPTLLLGDFNQIEFAEQKMRGRKYLPGARFFSEWRVSNGLTNLPTHGPAFTWCKNKETGDQIFEQLDRTYSNENWRCLFPEAFIVNHEVIASDHGAILLETSPKKTKRKRPYKIEAWCLEKYEVNEIIKQKWAMETKGSSMFKTMRKQEAAFVACRTWCLDRKMKIGITWDKFKEELEATREETNGWWYGTNEVEKRRQCQEKAKDQVMYWKQSAKIKWDSLGDQCTNFFFRSVKTRKGRNTIGLLKKEDGSWLCDEKEISDCFINSYTQLFNPAKSN